MSKLKLMTIVGTRPEIIRLSEIIKKADEYFKHTLVHTGQNYDYELNQIFFEDLELRQPDTYLNAAGETLGQTIGSIIAKSYDTLAEKRPDALLILGDTNSALCAVAAKRLKIPIFHMEAGNRCFDENLPEETNRRIVDHISDVNLCYSEHARRYLNAEGTAKERTYVVGSPMAEVLSANAARISASTALADLGLTENGFILLSAHREENIDNEKNFSSLMSGINALAEKYDMPIVYSMHPRSAKMIEHRDFSFHENVAMLKPLSFSDYNCLQRGAFCVVSDSGTLPEEAAILGFPAVSVRTSTERPEALDKGNVIIGGITKNEILQSVALASAMHANGDVGTLPPDYADKNVSAKVIKLIQSYTGIVNNVVWRKDV